MRKHICTLVGDRWLFIDEDAALIEALCEADMYGLYSTKARCSM